MGESQNALFQFSSGSYKPHGQNFYLFASCADKWIISHTHTNPPQASSFGAYGCTWPFCLTDTFKYSPQSAESATITAVGMKRVGLS